MYDPLYHQSPGCGERYPDSYWASISGQAPNNLGPLNVDIDVDVAIIGAGYTGMSCALHLAEEYGIKATILEANQSAWGCSGRNAGFILKTSGRKSFAQMQQQWGEEAMRATYQEMCEGAERVQHLISRGIDCDVQPAGYLKVAHKANKLKDLMAAAALQKKMFGYQVEILSKQEVRQQYMDDQNAFGAIRYRDGFGLNPLKLAWGYQKLAVDAGTEMYCSTPVTQSRQSAKGFELITPSAVVKAKKVVLATNGYTPQGFMPAVNNRYLPVLSQIIVTEPLTEQQLLDSGIKTNQVVMDTRALKYYYRKLPDNRILFGGRGAISGKSANDPYYANRLLSVLKSSFPALQTLRTAYAWSGWICMALDDIPHIYQNNEQNLFYSMGYCGAGVSFSSQAGKRLADKVAGAAVPNIPLYTSPLPKFPFAPLRRVGQWGYFQYGKVKDKWF
ncbi:FAD-dependent oxidoreductase [Thalassotalea sp. 1_MG-2023]|uniref:NAD(P)/FAD-dependent oxidoreductase n=1 Tax=Thalassotalea sp. 1_MG-2023 TaxID=3062680 RepID=UPI0026E367EB|nr:FAD-dependent oxidoreductase [Thalassotalea sp. 1_MG-2023]MDO6427460.1 FAD-dependent oxidoreductase [Thalassotalea sp. 1_MG-2023]